MCGWWDWDCQDDNPICEYCMRVLTSRVRLAFPDLPLAVCARIVYWEECIDDSWLTDGSMDSSDEQRRHPGAALG